MLTLEEAKKISAEFVKDACNYLKIDFYSIRIMWAPFVFKTMNIPQIAEVLIDDTIVVSEEFLNKFKNDNSFTSLRFELYSRVRFIAKRREAYGNLPWINEIEDAMNFSNALCFLKGLQLPCSHELDPDKFFAGALHILDIEFGLHGKVFRTIAELYKGNYFYKVHLDDIDCKRLICQFSRKESFTGKEPSIGEKGSLENPFNSVYDAVDYIKKIEHKAYEQDTLINEIANMKYFYDPNQESFRIMWASPYVAQLKNTYPKNSFVISQMAPIDSMHPDNFYFSLKPNLYKHKFLYRGQSSYYPGKPCKPNMYRDIAHNDVNYFLDYIIFAQEMELLIKSHPLVQLLEKGIELLHDTFKIRMHYSGLAQHYYNKSCMLDFTSDIEVMKFFATTDYIKDIDEYVPITDEKGIGIIYYYELKFPEAFQQHDHYALKTIGKQVFSRSGLQNGFLLEMDKTADLKETIPEIKKVYFHQNSKISKEIFERSNNGEIYFPEDILQHAWHDRMKQRFDEKIVSRKTVLLNAKRNAGETEESITQKLKEIKISVDDFEPKFTKEELRDFYKNIDQWWNEFCSDINFSDAENELYRDAMKNVIHNSKYAWAFKCNIFN